MRRIVSTAVSVVLVALGLVGASASPSSAAGETFKMVSLTAPGCTSGAFAMTVDRAGLDGGSYIAHTRVTVDGLVYMNEAASISVNGQSGWNLFDNFSYGAVDNQGTWPIPSDTRMLIEFTLERPQGTVLYAWTTVVTSCNSPSIIHNVEDLCPSLSASTFDGCPARSLSLAYDAGSKRLVGWLAAKDAPQLYARKPVVIWRVKPGPDVKVATVRTKASGFFSLAKPRKKGTYYATTKALLKPGAFSVPKETSPQVKVPRR